MILLSRSTYDVYTRRLCGALRRYEVCVHAIQSVSGSCNFAVALRSKCLSRDDELSDSHIQCSLRGL